MLCVLYCWLWCIVLFFVLLCLWWCGCKELGYCQYVGEWFGFYLFCLNLDCFLLWVYVVFVGEMCVVQLFIDVLFVCFFYYVVLFMYMMLMGCCIGVEFVV